MISDTETVVWHDLECGGYEQDLSLWLSLAAQHAGSEAVLDVGAGSGRVALVLARAGHRVVALDSDQLLLDALARRAGGLPVQGVCADARDFELPGRTFSLCLVPMQTLQLLGGEQARVAFMRCAHRQLTANGVLAASIAVAEDFEEFQWHQGDPFPLPDIVERDSHVYSSQPTAVRRTGDVFLLERKREVIDGAGNRRASNDQIALDIVSVGDVEEAGQRAGLKPLGVREIPATGEHIGSQVVILGA